MSEDDDSSSKNLSKKKENIEDEKVTIVPYKAKILKIFKGNSYYLLDRYRYDINVIMMLLDLNKINKLADFYKNYPDGIEKVLFIDKMKKELPYNLNDPMDESNLVYGLYKFFCEIDFNGDGHMQWEEFTQFIIDTVEGDNDAKVDENEDDTQSKIFSEKLMQKYKRYMISQRIKDNLIHKRDISYAVFLPRIDLMVVNEYGTKKLRIYNPKTGRSERSVDLDTYLNPVNYLDNSLRFKTAKEKEEKKKEIKKKNEKENKSFTYSVLSLFQWQSIIAMCLSDKRIVFFNFASEDRIELIHEMKVPVLEKRIWYLPEHNMWVSSGMKIEKNLYYTLNELDVEFELHNQKYDVYYNEGHPYRNYYCDINPHKGEILDCIEILKPMLVLTACMDGKIRLINVNDRDIIKSWNQHSLGVRSLTYNPLMESVGYILSVGFEYYINLYCTDLSIDEAYKGKLEGHYAPVICCKFLSHSYMAVSVDEECNVRLWDTRVKLCLQLIPPSKKNFKVVNLLVLNKYNKFVVYGNKMLFYDAKFREEEHQQKNQVKDDNYPIKVDFNYYYQQFFVTTFKDVRVYTKDGKLYKCYKKLTQNEHFENDVKIKYFLFENNYRKFYLGFSNGAIMQFNAGNGSLIKPINEEEIEKDGIQTYKYDHIKEITSLFYFYSYGSEDDNFILISTSYDSMINMYNENNPEETEKLRTLRGGHTIDDKINEIWCMDFSVQLNLFATGSSDGLVVIWDFEMSKIDDICFLPKGKSEKIIAYSLKFLDPYPILVVAYSDGTLYFWGIKNNLQFQGKCFLRCRNYFKYSNKIELCSVKSMIFLTQELTECPIDIPLKKYFDIDSPFMNPDKEYIPPPKKVKQRKMFFELNNNNSEDENSSEEDDGNLNIVPDIYKNEYIDNEFDPERYYNITEEDDNNKNSEQLRHYLLLGDTKGHLKLLDLMGIMRKYNFEASGKVIIKSTFNLMKKDDINVETILNHNIQQSQRQKIVFPQFLNLYQNIIRHEWKAHHDEITNILLIKEPLSFCSSSKDKFVKIWNFKCECLGVINTLPKLAKITGPLPEWNFKVNEEKILEKEINEVVKIFEEVNVEKIMVGSKEDKKVSEMVFEEKSEKKNEIIKEAKEPVSKKRYKKIEVDENKKYRNNKKEEEEKFTMSYEEFFVKDAQRKIEDLINVNIPKEGMNEITLKMINNYVEAGGEENNINNSSKKQKNSIKGTPNRFMNKNDFFGSKQKSTIITFNNKFDYMKKNLQTPQDFILNKKTSKIPILKYNSENAIVNSFGNKTNNNLDKKNMNKTISNFNTNISNTNDYNNKTTNINNIINNNNNNISIHPGYLTSTNWNRKNNNNINKSKYNRDSLYSAKLFNRKNVKSARPIIKKKGFNNGMLELPKLNVEKIIFKKGEVEKLLNYEFYKSSYKLCIDRSKPDNVTNSSIKKNYKNNWKMVEQYTSDFRNMKFLSEDDNFSNNNNSNINNNNNNDNNNK